MVQIADVIVADHRGGLVKQHRARAQSNDTVGKAPRKVWLMRTEDYSDAAISRCVGDQFQNAFGVGWIEVADRFIRQYQLRLLRQAAGDGHSLALTT
jgi:hypothetical protein